MIRSLGTGVFISGYALIKSLIALVFLSVAMPVDAQYCISQELLHSSMTTDDRVKAFRLTFEEQLQDWLKNNPSGNLYRDVITINVVVHVVWNESEEMISEDQVLSQIEVLNEDFRMLNTSLDLVTFPPFVSILADMELEFQLALVDPNGNPTNGINYVQTEVDNIASKYAEGKRRICHDDLGGADAWCYHNYLNIWVGAFDGGVLGEASFPGQEIAHPEEDGIRISYKAFGRTANLEAPYNLGRTLTHEIGHYFNLFHPWGQSSAEPPNLDCTGDDGIEDTPKQAFNYRNTCFLTIHQSCGTPDLHFNFMNYTDDACMAMFTQGQKEMVTSTIMVSRPGLLNSSACSVAVDDVEQDFSMRVFPNPANEVIQISIPLEGREDFFFWITDVYGKRVVEKKQLQPGNNLITLGNLKNGFYLVTLSDNQRFFTEKIAILN